MSINTLKRYPAKLLLFGEHAIIQGSCALALPFDLYYGSWIESKTGGIKTGEEIKSRSWLYKICDELCVLKADKELKSSIDVEKFEKKLDAGLWFDSNIPLGYGLGSSGSVCAAIYETFANPIVNDFEKLQEELAQLENFFHGKSSGIDPLTCFLQKLLLISETKEISTHELPDYSAGKGAIFLLDSLTPRSTAPLVNYFVEQCSHDAFLKNCVIPLRQANRMAVDAFLQQHKENLLSACTKISELQYNYFSPMILEEHKGIWLQGLNKGNYSLKLCGAGGGGFMLGFANDWQEAKKSLKDYKLRLVFQL